MTRSRSQVNRAAAEIRRKNRAVALKTRFDLSIAPFTATEGLKPCGLTPLLVSAAIRLD